MRAWPKLLILLTVVVLSAQNEPETRRAEPEESLRARITEFYSYFKEGKYRQAEALVAEESRDDFYGANKAKILDFEIKEVNLNSDSQSAKVVVMCKMVAPMGIGPVPAPLHSEWRQAGGEWFLYLPERRPGDEVPTPFGRARVGEGNNLSAPPMPRNRPTIKSLSKMYQVRGKRVLSFRSKSETPETQTVTLFNPGPARLSLRHETGDLPGLEVTSVPEEIDPGEEITISFTYRPDVARLTGRRPARFTVIPLNRQFSIILEFK